MLESCTRTCCVADCWSVVVAQNEHRRVRGLPSKDYASRVRAHKHHTHTHARILSRICACNRFGNARRAHHKQFVCGSVMQIFSTKSRSHHKRDTQHTGFVHFTHAHKRHHAHNTRRAIYTCIIQQARLTSFLKRSYDLFVIYHTDG